MEVTGMCGRAGAVALHEWIHHCLRRPIFQAALVVSVAGMIGCSHVGENSGAVASDTMPDTANGQAQVDEAAGNAVAAAQRVLRRMPADVESVLAVQAPTRRAKNIEGGSTRITRRNGKNVILRVDRNGQEHEIEHKGLQEELFDVIADFDFFSPKPDDPRLIALPKDGLQWCLIVGREVRGKDRAEEDFNSCRVFQYEKDAADSLERELIAIAVDSAVLNHRNVSRLRVPIAYPPMMWTAVKPGDVDHRKVNRLPKPVLPTETVDVWMLRLTDHHLAFFGDEEFARELVLLDPEASNGLALTKDLDRALSKDPECYCWGMRRCFRRAPFHDSSFLNYCATGSAVTFRYDEKIAGVCNLEFFGSEVSSKQVKDYTSNVLYWNWEALDAGKNGAQGFITSVDPGTVHVRRTYHTEDSIVPAIDIFLVLGLQSLPTSL